MTFIELREKYQKELDNTDANIKIFENSNNMELLFAARSLYTKHIEIAM